MPVDLELIQVDDRGNNVTDNFGGTDHVTDKISFAIGAGWNYLRHRAAVSRNAQRLACFVDLFDQAKALGFEFGDGNISHDHYFIYSHKNGQF